VYPGSRCEGSIYLDDGHTFRYQQGEFLKQEFTCAAEGNSVRVKFGARQGTYTAWWKNFEVVIYGWPSERAEVKLPNGAAALRTQYDARAHALHIFVADIATEAELTVGR
jgi:alpha-glucosidase